MRPLTLLLGCLLISTPLLAQLPSYVPTDGLVAWYPFNGNANDESVYGNDGTVVGAALTTDRFGSANSAYNFDGNDHIEAPHQEWLNTGTGSKTWAGWGRKTSGNDHAHFLTKIEIITFSQGGKNQYLRYAPNEGIEFSEGQSFVGGNGVAIQSSSLLNQWVHLTGVKDVVTGTTRIYQNGILLGEIALQNPSLTFDNSGPLFIGCEHPYVSLPSGPQYFFGDLDDLGIWNRALSEIEITGLYSGMAPNEGCTDEAACNYDAEANLDDGSCVPSGCMEEGACNYNAAAECEGEACDYSCCPGPGCCVDPNLWDGTLQQCTGPEAICGAGTTWDPVTETCIADTPGDELDEDCSVFGLQELVQAHAVALEHIDLQDSLLLALQANLDTCTGNLDNTANNALDGPCAGENHVTYQGHNYGIIEIGDQCWFSENLDVEWFRDGSPIAHLQGTSEWLTTDEAGWCYPEDASGNALETWGRLYNFWVVGNNICPSGWHIPNFAEWFEGGNLKPWYEGQHPANEGITGGAMKVPGTQDWIAPNSGATNELGWNGRPSGSRDLDGQFSPVGTIATYHINNTFGGGEAHHTVLSTGSTDLYRISPWRGDAPETWHMGTAIRCVKN